MTLFKRLFIMLIAAYGFVLAALHGFSQTNDVGLAELSESIEMTSAAVVFYTDDPDARSLRTRAAVNAFQNRKINFLVMAGGNRPERSGGYNGARVMRQEALTLGIPNDKVITDNGSNDSISNLRSSIETLNKIMDQPFRLILVSDRLHLLRLSLIARMSDLQTPFLRQPILFLNAGGLPSGSAYLRRLNHELLGYGSLLLPDRVKELLLSKTRSS